MQPYFMPYIGYFQLMGVADEFVVYDNIKYTKKGWFNRNRILINGQAYTFTIPIKQASDFLSVAERCISDVWQQNRHKLLKRIIAAYSKAPYFEKAFPTVEQCILCNETNLFRFILNSLELIKNYLKIETPLCISSSIPIDHSLKSEDKVIAICKHKQSTVYCNPEGGKDLYNKGRFKAEGIDLEFLIPDDIVYRQFKHRFVERLSIIDLMMFISKDKIQNILEKYSIE